MLPFASRLTFRTHFDPTMLASNGGGTNSHVLLLINELYSASKASFHSLEFLPSKASFIDCGSSFSAVNDSEAKHSVKVKNPIPPTRRPTCRPTRRSTHHRHTTDASANTLPTRRPTHYRRVGRHTTDALVDTLPTRILTRDRKLFLSIGTTTTTSTHYRHVF